jgi:hypothetical protein
MSAPHCLRIELRVSRVAAALILAAYAMTAALLLCLPLAWSFRGLGIAVIACACAFALRKTIGASAPALVRLDTDRRIVVINRDGCEREGVVLADSYVGSRVTTIVWLPAGVWFARTMLIVADALASDDFRQLRVVLRHGREPVSDAGINDADAA